MNTKLYLIGQRFTFSGLDREVSSAHTDLYDGELIKDGGVWRFSYNAFNPPSVCFCREGILIHTLLLPLIALEIGRNFAFEPCTNGRVMYFPVFKNIPINISQEMYEEISEVGIFEYYLKKYKIKSIPNQYYILEKDSLPKNVILKNTKPLVFGIYRNSNPNSVLIPENIREVELWENKGLWILSERIYRLFQQYLDEDYYSVSETNEKELWS